MPPQGAEHPKSKNAYHFQHQRTDHFERMATDRS